MFRFFENLVDPYQPYTETDTPPTRLWPFLRDYVQAFRKVFAVTAVFSVGNAALEVAMIWYLGRLVDQMSGQSPADFLAAHWVELSVVAFIVLFIRPLVAGGSVGLLHNTIMTNFGTMMRWRAHRHVLRQPVGWFESDFAGRIANRDHAGPPGRR
jgi:ATP-binding cassette, subfamily B, multidrug efflux pump